MLAFSLELPEFIYHREFNEARLGIHTICVRHMINFKILYSGNPKNVDVK